jgi:hypothetical protein
MTMASDLKTRFVPGIKYAKIKRAQDQLDSRL